MDFIIGFSISANRKGDNYNLILVIINRLTKMVYNEPVKVMINALGRAKVIIDVVMRHYRVPKLIVMDQNSLFIFKFWFSLCYFLKINKKLSITSYS